MWFIYVLCGDGGEVVVWVGCKVDDFKFVLEVCKVMIEEIEDEYCCLFYVVMMCVVDCFIVGGLMFGNRKDVCKLSWYDLVNSGFVGLGLEKDVVEMLYGKVMWFVWLEDVVVLGILVLL